MKPADYDMVILACPPAEEADRLAIGITEFTSPPGATLGQCDLCKRGIYIGLKQQEYIALHPKSPTLCFLCGAKASTGPGVEANVANLGGIGSQFKYDPNSRPKS